MSEAFRARPIEGPLLLPAMAESQARIRKRTAQAREEELLQRMSLKQRARQSAQQPRTNLKSPRGTGFCDSPLVCLSLVIHRILGLPNWIRQSSGPRWLTFVVVSQSEGVRRSLAASFKGVGGKAYALWLLFAIRSCGPLMFSANATGKHNLSVMFYLLEGLGFIERGVFLRFSDTPTTGVPVWLQREPRGWVRRGSDGENTRPRQVHHDRR